MRPLLALLLLGAAGEPAWLDGGWVEQLTPGAEATLPPGRYRGPWTLRGGVTLHAREAVLEGAADGGVTLTLSGTVHLDGLHVLASDGGTGIRVQPGAVVDLQEVRLSGPAASQIYLARAALTLSGADIEGGQYGVLAERAGALTVRRCRFTGQSRDGVAAVHGAATLEENRFRGPFGEAALMFIDVDGGVARRNHIDAAGAVGIKLVNSRAALSDNRVAGARTDVHGLEGEDVYAEASELSFDRDLLTDSAGPALTLIHSRATNRALTIEHSAEVAVSLEQGSSLRGAGMVIRHAPSGIVIDVGTLAPDGGIRFEDVAIPFVRLPP